MPQDSSRSSGSGNSRRQAASTPPATHSAPTASRSATQLSEDYTSQEASSSSTNKFLFRIFAILEIVVSVFIFILWISGWTHPVIQSSAFAWTLVTIIWILCPLAIFFLIKDYKNSPGCMKHIALLKVFSAIEKTFFILKNHFS